MSITSLSGLPAGAIAWEAAPGERSLTVIVKATFALAPGELALARVQEPLCEERPWDESVLASLHAPGDFVPSKRRVDVSLVGHAYAPRGVPTSSLVARLTLGELTKAIRVTGDRTWTEVTGPGLAPGPPAPFQRVPLRYERASLSAENPVGIDVHGQPRIGLPALANLEHLEHPEHGDHVEGTSIAAPCFAPIAPTWRTRRRLVDDAATFWAHAISRDPRDPRVAALPPGVAPRPFDFAFFNAAPPDQQVDLVRPGTTLELENMHPEHPRLVTRLPALRPQVFLIPAVGIARAEEIVLRCDTIWIDTDRALVAMTWRGVTGVGAESEGIGGIVAVADPEGKRLRWASVEKRITDKTAPTLRLGPNGATALDAPDEPPPPDDLARRHDAVKVAAWPAPPVDIEEDAEAHPTTARIVVANGLPPPAPLRAVVMDDETTNTLGGALEDDRPHEVARDRPIPGAAAVTPRVARHGTLIVDGDADAKPSAPTPTPTLPPSAEPPALPAEPPPRSLPRSGLTLRKDLTLERCAEIAASLSQRRANRAAVLRSCLLTEASWALVDQHWKKVIAAEAEAGLHATEEAFDDAFVRARERDAKPIDLATFARLAAFVERGEVGRLLTELELELGDLLRLQRVWARRAEASPALAEELAAAMERARGDVGG